MIARRVLRLSAALSMAVCVVAAPLAALAQETLQPDGSTLRETFGDWQLHCAVNQALVEECFIGQAVDEQESGQRALTAMVFKAPEGANVLRLMVPLGVLLLAGVNVAIDGANVGDVEYIACFPDGCMTEVALNDEVLGRFKAGSEAVVTIFDLGERPVPLPVSLSGFTAAFGAL